MTKIPVVHTKVILPRRREDLLSRKRLLDLLNDLLDDRLVIVTAPAGYGKTSLLIDLACQHELPFCWYNLDTLDQDPLRFIAHFIASISQRFPGFGEQSNASLQAMSLGNLSLEYVLASIIEEIYQVIREHFVMVIDDYHQVADSQPVNVFINRFVQEVGENCHLVLLSRSLLPLDDLPLLVARSQASGLGMRELAFRADEIQALMLQNYHQVIPLAAADELVQKTEGWITGLLLSAQTMWQGMSDRILAARASGVGLYDYLASQVLDQQPPEIREFLLRTSLLEEFDVRLCQAVLGTSPPGMSWQEMMVTVLRQNLFVLPVGESGTWLRYHHLFRDFLQNQLNKERPDEENRILRSLAYVYAKREEWEKAHAIYQRLQDIDANADLIVEAGSSLVKNSRNGLLAAWIDELPVEVVTARPALLARRGIVAATQGETVRGLALLDRAVSAWRLANNRPRLAGTLVWRATTHYMQGSYSASLNDVDEVFSISANDPDLMAVRADALRIKGQNYRALGKVNEAINYFLESLAYLQTVQDTNSIAKLSLDLGAAYHDAGDFETSLSYYHHAVEYHEGERNLYAVSSALNDLGFLYYVRGEYEQANATLQNAIMQAKRSGNIRAETFALISLGDLYAALGLFQAAQDAYRQARQAVRKINDRFLVYYLDLVEVGLARARGDLTQAHQLLTSLEQQYRAGGLSYNQGLYFMEAGRLALAEGKAPQAVAHLRQAVEAFTNGGQRIEAARASIFLAEATYATGDLNTAVMLFDDTLQQTLDMKNRHFLVMAARGSQSFLEDLADTPQLKIQIRQLREQVSQFESKIPALKRYLRRHKTVIQLKPPKIRIQAFGMAKVTVGGIPIISQDWQVESTRDLLFILLTTDQGWTKESLGGILWPDISPAQLKTRFKNTLYRLRRVLEQDVIQFDGDHYAFNRSADYEYDVELFLDLLSQAEKEANTHDKISAYQEALQLYQGEYLPEIEATWVVPEREYLRQAYVKAGLKLAEIYLAEADIESVLGVCQRLVKDDPCLEEAHRLAMQAYAARGSRVEITRQYHRLQRALLDELNSTPSPQTEELYRKLMN